MKHSGLEWGGTGGKRATHPLAELMPPRALPLPRQNSCFLTSEAEGLGVGHKVVKQLKYIATVYVSSI